MRSAFLAKKARRTLHNEDTIIAQIMIKFLQHPKPLTRPLLRAITPRTIPLVFSPRVAYNDKSFATAFLDAQDTVSVPWKKPRSSDYGIFGVQPETDREEALMCVDKVELLVPKAIVVKNVLHEGKVKSCGVLNRF